MLRDNEWCTKLRGVIVDEAHCVKKWYGIINFVKLRFYFVYNFQGRYLPRYLVKDR